MGQGIYGLIGGGIAAGIGVAYALRAMFRSIRSCRTPESRDFMLRFTAIVWLALVVGMVVIFFHAIGVAPDWAYWVVMVCMIGSIWPLKKLVKSKMATLEPESGNENIPV